MAFPSSSTRSCGEQVADAMGTDTATLRPVMKALIVAGQVESTGKGRGTRYAVV